jgi:dihydropteroate synthase
MRIKGRLIDFNKPLTMGILNLTGDSFYAGSRVQSPEAILAKAAKMLEEGADILDLGAYSTRPGASEVSEIQERDDLCDAISAIRKEYPDSILSADTFRAGVANNAVSAGADIINDVGVGDRSEMFETLAKLSVPYIMMHNRGTPKTMNSKAVYSDLMGEIVHELSAKVNKLRSLGVADIIIDPGFGFAKTADQNFELLRRLGELKLFDAPILLGLSRKRTIWKTLNTDAAGALNGTTALNMLALANGANILRVHDVKEAVEAVKLWQKYHQARKQ